MMDEHLQAALSMTGMILDAFGGLLLAYDLLGGRHGPLRVLVRVTFYTMLYGLVTGLFMGFKFGLISGIGLGTIIGLDMSRRARGYTEFSFRYEAAIGLLRLTVIGLATALAFSPKLGLVVALLGYALYLFGLKRGRLPLCEYHQNKLPELNKNNLLFALYRGMGIWCIGFVSVMLVQGGQEYVSFGMRLGLSVGLSLALLALIAPMIEWWADQLPEKALGGAGAVMFVVGFWLQATPSMVLLFNQPVL